MALPNMRRSILTVGRGGGGAGGSASGRGGFGARASGGGFALRGGHQRSSAVISGGGERSVDELLGRRGGRGRRGGLRTAPYRALHDLGLQASAPLVPRRQDRCARFDRLCRACSRSVRAVSWPLVGRTEPSTCGEGPRAAPQAHLPGVPLRAQALRWRDACRFAELLFGAAEAAMVVG